MLLGNISIAWINSFKYLGVTFNNNVNQINVDCHAVQMKFYSACIIVIMILLNCIFLNVSVHIYLLIV